MSNNIVKGKTLKEYNEKYKTLRYELICLSKKEVDNFDEKYKSTGLSLLSKKKWCLIDDTYYEIPKPFRWVWFRNLNKGIQAATYVAIAGIVATGATFLSFRCIKATKMVNKNEWRQALDEITEGSKGRNFTFTGEFDDKLSSNKLPARVNETVYVVNNEEHIIKNIIEEGKMTKTSESCYKVVDNIAYYVKDKTDGKWSEYKYDSYVYNLPSGELKDLSMFKLMYEDFKFDGEAYVYTQSATEEDPSYKISLKFKHKKIISFVVQEGDRKDYRKFEFTNYGNTSLNI